MDKTKPQSTSDPKPGRSDTKAEANSSAAKLHHTAEEVRNATTQRVESMRGAAESARARAAERVRKLSNAVRKLGEHMRVEEQVYIADQAGGASQRLDNVADYIARAELGSLMRDAEQMARRNPGLVFGGTFMLGLAAGRFFKSSGKSSGPLVTATVADVPGSTVEASPKTESSRTRTWTGTGTGPLASEHGRPGDGPGAAR